MSDTTATTPKPSGSEVRKAFEERIVNDLLGPVGGTDETLQQDPRYRYLVGMLAPAAERYEEPAAGTPVEDGETDDSGVVPGRADRSDHGSEGEFPVDESTEDRPPPATSLFPSSMGLSFAVEGDVTDVAVVVEWGRYVKAVTDEDGTAEGDDVRVWERHHEQRPATLLLVDDDLDAVRFETSRPAGAGEADLGAVVLSGRARQHNGYWLVELFLANRQIPQQQNKSTAWLFQPKVTVRLPDGTAGFVGRGEALGADVAAGVDEIEQLALEVQYRDFVEFAVGHGVGTHAEASADNPRRAVSVETSFLPTYEVPNTVASTVDDTPQLAGLELDMATLAGCDDADRLRGWLSPLADGYRDWLDDQHAAAQTLPDGDLRAAGLHAVKEAKDEVADKISAGIELVCTDPDALAAFRFANRVMHQQRIRTDAIRAARQNPDLDFDALIDPAAAGTVDVPDNRRWRPFQLAFVLLNLPELVDPAHPDRAGDSAKVDLLFFPTGGGKTEAYLGLTAFTFAIRRLHHDHYDGLDGSDGIAVLMRYTLRLLTAQQFERAAAMVCAAENVRKEDQDTWGQVPFRLGMWVGSSVTPNDSETARRIIEDAQHYNQDSVSGASPVQLTACPWCGSRFSIGGTGGVHHVKTHVETPYRRTLVYCPNSRCEFSERNAEGEGVPVVTVDEEIYRLLPSFLIGTIDKFAQLPWYGATRLLFGLGDTWCERHGWVTSDLRERMRGTGVCDPKVTSHHKTGQTPKHHIVQRSRLLPPTLTIQDEFHLITGPLGSMAGLFEAAVDELSSWEHNGVTVRPKIVASTATIRRATQQTRGVFDRDVRMFPPQVTDVTNTFFAHQVPPDDTPGRRYLGVCAPARRLKEIENRVFTTVMGAGQDLYDPKGENLGIDADPYMTTIGYFSSIRELAGMRRLAGDELPVRLWRLTSSRRPGLRRRPRPEVVELTSRVSSATIRQKLDQLAEQHRPDREKHEVRPVDLLLATNMISVGVDVSRWGNMVVVGQPKSTAEYVQATSRVGRDAKRPGLVVTIYNWSRPRDMSHYETFEHYHATFYRHVEALSVTPFADRALDRGLTAVLVGLIRALDDDANPNAGAQTIDRNSIVMQRVVDAIVRRAGSVTSDPDTVDSLKREVQARLDDLVRRQQKHSPYLAYESRGEGASKQVPLLRKDDAPGDWDQWTLPNSLRNTEPGVNVLIDHNAREDGTHTWTFPARAKNDSDATQPEEVES